MEFTLYGKTKQNYLKRVFSVFYVEKHLIGCKQTNIKKKLTLQKRYILSALELVTYKKRENGCKTLGIRKHKDIKKTCIINVLYFHKNHKSKNANTCVYGEVS